MMTTENRWKEMRATIVEEANQPVAPRLWVREFAAVFSVHGAVALIALVAAEIIYGHSPRATGITTPLFVGSIFTGVIATLALAPTSRRFALVCVTLFTLGAIAHIAPLEMTWETPWWASANCALGELLMAALPALATTIALRRFAFQADRALLGGVAAAATGLWVLDLTCPANGAYHALAFHLVPAGFVIIAALVVRRALSSRTQVP